MRDLASTFARLLGRQPSEQEVQSLYRVKDALQIGDNDALWLVLMALQSYDSLYRKYPAMISAEIAKMMEAQRLQMAAQADAAIQKSLAKRSQALPANPLITAQTMHLMHWAWLCLSMLLFGSLCVLAGAVLASGHPPFWVKPDPNQGLHQLVLGALARTPAGWMAFVGGAAAGTLTLWKLRVAVPNLQRWPMVLASLVLMALSVLLLIPTL